jgi:cob(I)alamin adenosyltransferase
MTRIYTRSGDNGQTGLYGGSRISKGDAIIDVLGTIDEAIAHLAVCTTYISEDESPIETLATTLQSHLMMLGSAIAGYEPANTVYEPDFVEAMERSIDASEAQLPPLKTFILPGGHPLASQLHLTRSVVRRLERKLVAIEAHDAVPLVNRMADLLFSIARLVNHLSGIGDTTWSANLNKTEVLQ